MLTTVKMMGVVGRGNLNILYTALHLPESVNYMIYIWYNFCLFFNRCREVALEISFIDFSKVIVFFVFCKLLTAFSLN